MVPLSIYTGTEVEDMYLTMQRMSLTRPKIGPGKSSAIEDILQLEGVRTALWSLETIVGCPIGGEQVIAAYMLSSEV